MIVPSRWFAGGMGLDEFRESMLADDRMRSIDDYLSASDVFPGIGLKGGVCYFLWDRDNRGPCQVKTHFKEWPVSTATRSLLEEGVDVFIRFNEGLSILKKVVAVETGSGKSLALPEAKKFDETGQLDWLIWTRQHVQGEREEVRRMTLKSTETVGSGTSQDRKLRTSEPSSTSGKSSSAARPRDRQPRHLPAQDHQHTIYRRARKHLVVDVLCISGRSTRRLRPRVSCPTSPAG